MPIVSPRSPATSTTVPDTPTTVRSMPSKRTRSPGLSTPGRAVLTAAAVAQARPGSMSRATRHPDQRSGPAATASGRAPATPPADHRPARPHPTGPLARRTPPPEQRPDPPAERTADADTATTTEHSPQAPHQAPRPA